MRERQRTLQGQLRPSGQSVPKEPRGSQEQVGDIGGRIPPPGARQSLDVPIVASPV